MSTLRIFPLMIFTMVWTISTAQDFPKTIFEMYELKSGGCDYDMNNLDTSQKMFADSDIGFSEPIPKAAKSQLSAKEEVAEIFKDLKEDIQKNKAKLSEAVVKIKGGSQCFGKKGKWGLRSSKGKKLIKPQFDFVVADKNHSGFMGYKNGKCKYYDGKTGKVLVSQAFYSIQFLSENVYKIQSAKGYGLYSKGKVILEPEHKFIRKEKSGDRVYFVIADNFILLEDMKTMLPDWGGGMGIHFFDDHTIATNSNIYNTKKKKKLICDKGIYIKVVDAKKGLLSVKKGREKFHFLMDKKGNIVSETPFNEIKFFGKEGLASAATSDGSGGRRARKSFGLIDQKGNWVVEPKYQYLNYYQGVFSGRDMNNEEVKIDATTRKKILPEQESKSGQKYDEIKKINDNYSLGINGSGDEMSSEVFETKSGKVIQKDLKYNRMNQLPLGKGWFCEQEVYHAYLKGGEQFLDKNFKPLLPVHGRFFYHKNYLEGYSRKGKETYVTLYDCQGKPITVNLNGEKLQTFNKIKLVNDEMTYVYFNDNTGYMVPKKGEAQPMNYSLQFISAIGLNDYLRVTPYGSKGTGLVDAKGKELIPIKLKQLTNFDRMTGVASFVTYNKVAGLVDQNGDVVKNQFFEEINLLQFNLFKVKQGKKYGVINHKGDVLISLNYDSIYRRDGLIYANIGKKKEIFDVNGNKLN